MDQAGIQKAGQLLAESCRSEPSFLSQLQVGARAILSYTEADETYNIEDLALNEVRFVGILNFNAN